MIVVPASHEEIHRFIILNAPVLVEKSAKRLLLSYIGNTEDIQRIAEHVLDSKCPLKECEKTLIREGSLQFYKEEPFCAAIFVLSMFEFNDGQIARVFKLSRASIAEKRVKAEEILTRWLSPFGIM